MIYWCFEIVLKVFWNVLKVFYVLPRCLFCAIADIPRNAYMYHWPTHVLIVAHGFHVDCCDTKVGDGRKWYGQGNEMVYEMIGNAFEW